MEQSKALVQINSTDYKIKIVQSLEEMYYTPLKSLEIEVSLEAFMYNDFLYAKILCRKQPENRLKTVCIRIDKSLGYDEYLSMFIPFPEYKQRGEQYE